MNMCHHSFFHSHSLFPLHLRVCHLSGGSFVTARWASFLTPLSSPPVLPSRPLLSTPHLSVLQHWCSDNCGALFETRVSLGGVPAPTSRSKTLLLYKDHSDGAPSQSAGPFFVESLCGRGSPLLSDRLDTSPTHLSCYPTTCWPKSVKTPSSRKRGGNLHSRPQQWVNKESGERQWKLE